MRAQLVRVVLALGVLGACDGRAGGGPEAFEGVSAELPTGSVGISELSLVASYDLSSLTEDGELRDFGPHGLHGRLRAASRDPGLFGGARIFERVGQRVDLPESPAFDLDGPLTLAAWVRVDSVGLHQHIAACDDKWALWVTPDDRYRLGDTRGGGWSTAAASVTPGLWRPVVAVLRGGAGDPLTAETVSLYVDGELAAAEEHLRTDEARERAAWGPGELYATDACYLGFESHQGNAAHQEMPFVGAIDELLVFSRAWTEDEVAAFSTRFSPDTDDGDR